MAIMKNNNPTIERGPYRPPSEAASLLIRTTRNCPWNKCEFCPAFKGERFELRDVLDIKKDIQNIRKVVDKIKEISRKLGQETKVTGEVLNYLYQHSWEGNYPEIALWLFGGENSVFLQDADSLIMKTDDLVEVITCLKEKLPGVKRITSYGRSKTICKKSLEDLRLIQQAGLSRIHIGLETGYDSLLAYMQKGATARDHIESGRRVKEAGISLSEYVLLGLGGKEMGKKHAIETAKVLNRIDPDYIRARTLMVRKNTPLYHKMEKGEFVPLSEDEIIEEERELIENLDNIGSYFVSDHVRNLLGEVEGDISRDKDKMLSIIDRYRDLSPEDKLNFRLGRRANVYQRLDDFFDPSLYKKVEAMMLRIGPGEPENVERVITALMARVS